jgi:hypothetical protein
VTTSSLCAADLSAVFYDNSSIQVSFTAPKNSYLSTYYYVLNATNTDGSTTSATGYSSPIQVTGLSPSTKYTFTLFSYLDGVLGATTPSVTFSTTGYIYITDLSAVYYDSSGIKVVFTLSDNTSSSYYYLLTTTPDTGYITSISGSTSPITMSDLSGNTTYTYSVGVYYDSSYLWSATGSTSITTPAQSARDLSAIFYDCSSLQLSFTLPKNSYSSSVYYQLDANYGGTTTSISGSTTPLQVNGLISGVNYSCYVLTYLDGDLGSTSSLFDLSTSTISFSSQYTAYTNSTYNYTSVSVNYNKTRMLAIGESSSTKYILYLTDSTASGAWTLGGSLISNTGYTVVSLAASGNYGIVGITSSKLLYLIDWTNTTPTIILLSSSYNFTAVVMSNDGYRAVIGTDIGVYYAEYPDWTLTQSNVSTSVSVQIGSIIISPDKSYICYFNSSNNYLYYSTWSGGNYSSETYIATLSGSRMLCFLGGGYSGTPKYLLYSNSNGTYLYTWNDSTKTIYYSSQIDTGGNSSYINCNTCSDGVTYYYGKLQNKIYYRTITYTSKVSYDETPGKYPYDLSAIFYDSSAIEISFGSTYSSGTYYYLLTTTPDSGYTTSISGTSSPIIITGLSGNTIYTYTVGVYVDGVFTASTSSGVSVTTNYQAARDLSTVYTDASSLEISFTLPANKYDTSYYYILNATYSGTTISASGTTSPLQVTGLTNSITYACSVDTYVDGNLISTSDSYDITSGSLIKSFTDICGYTGSFTAYTDASDSIYSFYGCSVNAEKTKMLSFIYYSGTTAYIVYLTDSTASGTWTFGGTLSYIYASANCIALAGNGNYGVAITGEGYYTSSVYLIDWTGSTPTITTLSIGTTLYMRACAISNDGYRILVGTNSGIYYADYPNWSFSQVTYYSSQYGSIALSPDKSYFVFTDDSTKVLYYNNFSTTNTSITTLSDCRSLCFLGGGDIGTPSYLLVATTDKIMYLYDWDESTKTISNQTSFLTVTNNVFRNTNTCSDGTTYYYAGDSDKKIYYVKLITESTTRASFSSFSLSSTTDVSYGSTSTDYSIYAFLGTTSKYTITYTASTAGYISFFMVGGGGQGGGDQGGGGGAGGVVQQLVYIPAGTSTIDVSCAPQSAQYTNAYTPCQGFNSTITFNATSTTYTAYGGGYGGNRNSPSSGASGGGGGLNNGSGEYGSAIYSSSSNLGYRGSTRTGDYNAGAGGGAGSSGYSGSSNSYSGQGGDGVKITIDRISDYTPYSNFYWAGGGAGCAEIGKGGNGGIGGGGPGTGATSNGSVMGNSISSASAPSGSTGGNGGANTGGGGGGGSAGGSGKGGYGGSGIIILAI